MIYFVNGVSIIINILIVILGILLIVSMRISRIIYREKNNAEESLKKALLKNRIYDLWLETIINQIKITDYLVDNNYREIGIYGMADLGERLFQMLNSDSRLQVRFVMDKSPNKLGDFELLSVENDIPKVDIIIVTSEYYFDEICQNLSKKSNAKLISIKGLIGQASRRNI